MELIYVRKTKIFMLKNFWYYIYFYSASQKKGLSSDFKLKKLADKWYLATIVFIKKLISVKCILKKGNVIVTVAIQH